MTRKFFIATARIICLLPSHVDRWAVANEFVKLFTEENSRFDADRFLKACGLR